MKLISHRGNINGIIKEKENHPDYILDAIKKGYEVEIDIWFFKNKYFLGHDKPIYKIKKEFLIKNYKYLWIHCKNIEALNKLHNIPLLNVFFHDKDKYTLTSKRFIWAYPNEKLTENTICVLPEWNNLNLNGKKILGICSDYIGKYDKKI